MRDETAIRKESIVASMRSIINEIERSNHLDYMLASLDDLEILRQEAKHVFEKEKRLEVEMLKVLQSGPIKGKVVLPEEG